MVFSSCSPLSLHGSWYFNSVVFVPLVILSWFYCLCSWFLVLDSNVFALLSLLLVLDSNVFALLSLLLVLGSLVFALGSWFLTLLSLFLVLGSWFLTLGSWLNCLSSIVLPLISSDTISPTYRSQQFYKFLVLVLYPYRYTAILACLLILQNN